MMTNDPAAPPSRELLLLEVRAFWELGAFFAAYPMLRLNPRGDGHAVMVLPGMAADDRSTRALRTLLKDLGYHAYGWGLGPNHGPRPGVEEALRARLSALAERHHGKVSLIGWSLGGIFAREIARHAPQQVRSVITLGSPFAGVPRASNAWQLYERLSGRRAGADDRRAQMPIAPPVPTTAIFTRTDGVVAWQGCCEQPGPITENIEVVGSHSGLGHNPVVLHAIADRLAQPEGRWCAFERNRWRALIFPDPQRGDRVSTAHSPV